MIDIMVFVFQGLWSICGAWSVCSQETLECKITQRKSFTIGWAEGKLELHELDPSHVNFPFYVGIVTVYKDLEQFLHTQLLIAIDILFYGCVCIF